MAGVIYAAPFFTANALRFLEAMCSLDGVELALISQDSVDLLPASIRTRLHADWRVDDAMDTAQLLTAARGLSERLSRVDRILGVMEQFQVQLAEVREALDVPGLSVEAALNFRDKSRMKDVLRANGMPCARHKLVNTSDEAFDFANSTGFPLIVKPPDGAGAQNTFRVENDSDLRNALTALPPSAANPVLLEEFMTGTEHSFDTFTLNGVPLLSSVTHYQPTPLEVLRNPWIQWAVVLPANTSGAEYDDIKDAGIAALSALGMGTGMSHMEWFRRHDGSIAISEVGARPPGAQITTLISRAFDFDAVAAWARLVVFDQFTCPPQKYAVGIAYLRPQGHGKISAVSGLDSIRSRFGNMVTDFKIPESGTDTSKSYEGDGYIIVRHEETAVVQEAISTIISEVRVHLS